MRRALFLTGIASLSLAASAMVPATTHRGEALCRKAPELPKLSAEIAPQQAQGPVASYERDDYTTAPPPAPPSPPPPPATERDSSSADIAVSGSRIPSPATSGRKTTSTIPPAAPAITAPESAERDTRPYVPPMPAPPAGLLTAGDHDDLLNPLLYARYVARAVRELGQQIAGLPRVDTRRVVTVAVEDEAGRAAPFVPVRVTCADGNSLTFTTLADGRIALFPALDRLGDRVTVEAAGVRRSVTIDGASGGQEQTLVIGRPAQVPRKFDLMIALDSTGSMGDEIEFLKSELRSILGDLHRAYPDVDMRVGLVSYRDLGDDYVTRTDPLTPNFDTIQSSLAHTSGTGGGDMPEAMDQALIRAVGQDWRTDAVKSLLLVADAPPHDDLQGRAFAAVEAARARRVQIVPVAASGVDDRAEYFMRAVAAATQSRYIFLTDDSGIGNAHAEPDVDCYVVTQLATAIRRVLASQISGERVEPYPAEVIRTLGRYDHGRCILPRNFSIQ